MNTKHVIVLYESTRKKAAIIISHLIILLHVLLLKSRKSKLSSRDIHQAVFGLQHIDIHHLTQSL